MYIQTSYRMLKNKMTGSHGSGNVRIGNSNAYIKSFLRLRKLDSEKASTALNSTAFVVYPVQAILLIVSATRRRRFIENGHTLVGFLAVCHTQEQLEEEERNKHEEISLHRCTLSMRVPLVSRVRVTAEEVGRVGKERVFREDLKVLVGSLPKRGRERIFVKRRGHVE